MNEMKLFENPEFGAIRTVEVGGEPWLVGKDVAQALGYSDTSDALKRHVDPEDKLTRRFADSGQSREMYIINEGGLYSLVLSSKLPGAKKFRRWVTAEVLPSIRRHGLYAVDQLIENPDLAIQAFSALCGFRGCLQYIHTGWRAVKAPQAEWGGHWAEPTL